jgi:hypothetical protein
MARRTTGEGPSGKQKDGAFYDTIVSMVSGNGSTAK